MQKIDQLKSDIAHTIKESAEYKEYKRLEAVVNMDPNLKRSIDEFRRRNYEIQNCGQVEHGKQIPSRRGMPVQNGSGYMQDCG